MAGTGRQDQLGGVLVFGDKLNNLRGPAPTFATNSSVLVQSLARAGK